MSAWHFTSTTNGLEKNLTLRTDIPIPSLPTTPSATPSVLVSVISASINPIDYKLAEAMPAIIRKRLSSHSTPGLDFCGRVVAVSPSKSSANETFKPGDLIYGLIDLFAAPAGTLSQYIIAAANNCAKLAPDVDPNAAATIGVAGKTAYQSIAPHVTPGAGDKVFINGGSGGTGTFSIQIAKALGCFVTVSCSGEKAELCKQLGADEIIDYKQVKSVSEAMKAKGPVYKLCVDNVGTPLDLYRAADGFLMKEGGVFVQVGGGITLANTKSLLGRMFLPRVLGGGGRKYSFYTPVDRNEDLVAMAGWVADGQLKPVVEEVYKWEEVPRAFEKLKTGRNKGKLVVRVAEGK
ncbi:hypothetical protein B0T17DRAFT_493843 [Bombardia bombarda]|uniref:Enoyl reductase (ER) domain-containing protein n=1 Tax=Bombardia bombarda TaxID=252184 RepID=A0AA40C1U6_9PEZI|nr:hypothetical protein B0T17DRAFT_493843 [Bombardia bombarda]